MDDWITYFWDATHWQWWAIAVVLFSLEVLAPVFFLLWLGIAAVMVGFLVYLVPDLDWRYQLVVFTVLSVAVTVAGRRYFAKTNQETDQPNLNQRGAQLIGRKITLESDLTDGTGRVHIDDTTWHVKTTAGETIKKGSKITITAVDGASLIAE